MFGTVIPRVVVPLIYIRCRSGGGYGGVVLDRPRSPLHSRTFIYLFIRYGTWLIPRVGPLIDTGPSLTPVVRDVVRSIPHVVLRCPGGILITVVRYPRYYALLPRYICSIPVELRLRLILTTASPLMRFPTTPLRRCCCYPSFTGGTLLGLPYHCPLTVEYVTFDSVLPFLPVTLSLR